MLAKLKSKFIKNIVIIKKKFFFIKHLNTKISQGNCIITWNNFPLPFQIENMCHTRVTNRLMIVMICSTLGLNRQNWQVCFIEELKVLVAGSEIEPLTSGLWACVKPTETLWFTLWNHLQNLACHNSVTTEEKLLC